MGSCSTSQVVPIGAHALWNGHQPHAKQARCLCCTLALSSASMASNALLYAFSRSVSIIFSCSCSSLPMTTAAVSICCRSLRSSAFCSLSFWELLARSSWSLFCLSIHAASLSSSCSCRSASFAYACVCPESCRQPGLLENCRVWVSWGNLIEYALANLQSTPVSRLLAPGMS